MKAAGKKVVVSMGSMAASGGYYVAASADEIIANDSTLTGSIGVFGGKFAVADALRQFGVNPDQVRVGGEFASAYSAEKFTPTQRAKLLEGLQDVYDRFTGLVAKGRNMPLQKVQEIARGRVWSGEDAIKNGLVDKKGDLIFALGEAARLAGFKPEDGIDVRMTTHRTSPFELLTSTMMQAKIAGVPEGQILEALGGVVGRDRAEAVLQQLRQIGGQPGGAQLWSPPIVER
jgi:protease-4